MQLPSGLTASQAIGELKLGKPIDWLPNKAWKALQSLGGYKKGWKTCSCRVKAELGIDEHAAEMGAFVAETQELHRKLGLLGKPWGVCKRSS